MPEKFKRFYKIAFIFFVSISLIELVAFVISMLLGYYFIAERFIPELIITIILSCLLYLTKGQWHPEKANPQNFRCPYCGEEKSLTRIPKNFKQLITGGWTCSKCNKEVIPPNKNQNLVWIGLSILMILIGIGILLANAR